MFRFIQLSFLSLVFLLTGCELVGSIFEAGVYTGVFIVVLVIVAVLYIIIRFLRR